MLVVLRKGAWCYMEKQKGLLDDLFDGIGNSISRINKSLFCLFVFMDIIYFLVYMFTNSPDNMYTILSYLILYFVRPVFYEASVILIGEKYIKSRFTIRGAGVLLITELLFGVRLFVHTDIEALYTLMCIPLFLGILYGSKELVSKLFEQGLAILLGVFILVHFREWSSLSSRGYLNFVVAVVVFCCCYYCASLFVEYENSKGKIIDKYKGDYEVISNEACRDGLTRLYNFKTLQETAEDWIKTKRGVIFCIIDIDDFKKVNDTHGHEFGNVVLKRLSVLLSYRSNENVFIARYGGEEFGILTYGMNLKGVFNMMEKLRRTFRLEEYRETKDHYAFSGGIACYQNGMTVRDLFDSADNKLYTAKHNGKNQIVY